MNPGTPSSEPYEDRGGVNWFLRSWAPLAHPAWLILWCVATLSYLFLGRDRLGPVPWTLAMLFTCEAAASGAVLATGLLVQLRMVTNGMSKTSPGAWLVWIATVRMVFVIVAMRSGLADRQVLPVWYAATSSVLFLVPIYFGPPLAEWQHRWVAVVAMQAAPLLVHVLLSLALNSQPNGSQDAYLERWLWLPDLLSATLLLIDARRRSRPFEYDEFHRAGLVIYATQSAAVAVIVNAIWWVVFVYTTGA